MLVSNELSSQSAAAVTNKAMSVVNPVDGNEHADEERVGDLDPETDLIGGQDNFSSAPSAAPLCPRVKD
jgi:hypothetical protein